ncbi:MAG: hypothetical protein AAGC44_05250 [Planctomycetota bacterium]
MNLDKLKPLALDVPAFYQAQADATRDVRVTLDQGQTLRRTASARSFLDMTGARNAALQLDHLPDTGESVHGIMRGNFAGFDFVPAVLRLAGCAIVELNVATLGFKDVHASELVTLMDAGDVGRVSFICSHFYKSHEGEVYDSLHAALTQRGGRCLAMRCHAKLLLFELADGRHFALEMSANLRSCNNLEQFVFTHDTDLVRFHRGWMDRVLTEAGA